MYAQGSELWRKVSSKKLDGTDSGCEGFMVNLCKLNEFSINILQKKTDRGFTQKLKLYTICTLDVGSATLPIESLRKSCHSLVTD